MKIISPVKDYYDYVATIYGIDNSIIYKRINLDLPQYNTHFNSATFSDGYMIPCATGLNTFPQRDYWNPTFDFRYLIVVGKRYLIVRRRPKESFITNPNLWELYNVESHPEVFAKKTGRWQYSETLTPEYCMGGTSPELVELSKTIKQPVFFVDASFYHKKEYVCVVAKVLPRLSELHFATVMSPEKLYQEIEYFIGNTLKDCPDTQPPVNISNNDLIVGKGFDIKQSFRHRK